MLRAWLVPALTAAWLGAEAQGVRAGTVQAREGAVIVAQAPLAGVKRIVAAHRTRLEGEVADLAVILAAQSELIQYVENGGGARDKGLDPRLCPPSALRPLCAELAETFGGDEQ